MDYQNELNRWNNLFQTETLERVYNLSVSNAEKIHHLYNEVVEYAIEKECSINALKDVINDIRKEAERLSQKPVRRNRDFHH